LRAVVDTKNLVLLWDPTCLASPALLECQKQAAVDKDMRAKHVGPQVTISLKE